MAVNPNGIIKGFNILKYKPIGMFVVNDMKKAGDFLRFIRSVTAGTDNGNITVIISELCFPASKSTDTDTQVL